MWAVNVDKRFQAVFLALLHDNVEDFHAVFHGFICIQKIRIDDKIRRIVFSRHTGNRVWCVIHPRNQQFCRNRHPNDIDAAVGNFGKHIIHVTAPQIMHAVFSAVEAEPVCTCQPDFVAVLVIEAAADCVQPVIIVRILCLCRDGGKAGDCSGCCRQCHHSCQQNCL